MFLICFISIHLPLLAMASHILLNGAANTKTMLIMLLLATLVGTAVCLSVMWWLIRPLRLLCHSIDHYREKGLLLPVATASKDEIGVVSRAISSLVFEMDEMMSRLRHDANTDALTGLANRRLMLTRGPEELEKAIYEMETLSLLVFDLDHFKTINDRFGHETGDKVLMAVSQAVRNNLRPTDLASRIGGEEFCILLPKTTSQQAHAIAERLRRSLETLNIAPLDKGRITASFGLAESQGLKSNFQSLMVDADTALYKAKQDGRNCVRLFE